MAQELTGVSFKPFGKKVVSLLGPLFRETVNLWSNFVIHQGPLLKLKDRSFQLVTVNMLTFWHYFQGSHALKYINFPIRFPLVKELRAACFKLIRDKHFSGPLQGSPPPTKIVVPLTPENDPLKLLAKGIARSKIYLKQQAIFLI